MTSSFLPESNRYGIEPLEDYFSRDARWKMYRNPDVHYTQGMGERIPFPNAYFDLVVLWNVLDHTSEPSRVLSEVARVLKPDAKAVIQLNTFEAPGLVLQKILRVFGLEKHHPFLYSKIKLLSEIQDAMLKPQRIIHESTAFSVIRPAWKRWLRWILSCIRADKVLYTIIASRP